MLVDFPLCLSRAGPQVTAGFGKPTLLPPGGLELRQELADLLDPFERHIDRSLSSSRVAARQAVERTMFLPAAEAPT